MQIELQIAGIDWFVVDAAAVPADFGADPPGVRRASSSDVSERADELKRRTKQFALDVIQFVRTLPETDDVRAIGRQLLRSGPGVASNYRAACRARSRAEFVARIGIALEESDESSLWFEIITEAAMDRSREAFRLLQESNELSAILAQSCITARASLPRPDRP